MLSLVMNPGLSEEQTFAISEGIVTIGRTKDNAVSCLHKSLSRRHAQLEYDGATVRIIDLESKNGVFFNGRRVDRCEVAPGETFRCGDITFLLERPNVQDPRPGVHAPAAQTLPSPLVLPPNFGRRGVSNAAAVTQDDDATRFKDKLFLLLRATELCVARLPIDRVLEELVVLAVQVIELDRIVLLTAEPGTGEMKPRVVKAFAAPTGQLYSKRVVDAVITRGSAASFPDVSSDRTLPGAAAADADVHGAMCAPIDPGTGTIGVIYIDSLSNRDCFRPDDLALLRALANVAAVAIENATLRT